MWKSIRLKNFPWNQLSSNFFSKNVDLTENMIFFVEIVIAFYSIFPHCDWCTLWFHVKFLFLFVICKIWSWKVISRKMANYFQIKSQNILQIFLRIVFLFFYIFVYAFQIPIKNLIEMKVVTPIEYSYFEKFYRTQISRLAYSQSCIFELIFLERFLLFSKPALVRITKIISWTFFKMHKFLDEE